MLHGKILQKVVLFLFIGSLKGAMAGPVREWDSFDGIAPEGATPIQRGLGKEEIQVPEDAPTEAVEITMPKRRNGMKIPRKALAMVPAQSNRIIKGIKDETATTGDNARRRLPPSVKHQETAPPFMHDNIQAISNYLPTLQHEKID